MSTGIDPRFKLLPQVLTIKVPDDYDHDTQLATFAKQHRASCMIFNESFTDANFANVSVKLLAGRTYKVKQFIIKRTVSSGDCLAFLHSQTALLVGAQGSSLVFDQNRCKVAKNRMYVCFDVETNLLIAHGCSRVPGFYTRRDGNFSVRLVVFDQQYRDLRVLLCFCNETSGT